MQLRREFRPLRLLSGITLVFASALGLVGCGNSAADIAVEDAVNIRIANETGFLLDRVWLGGSTSDTNATFTTRYVNVKDGEVSNYLPVEPLVINYDRLSSTSDGERRFGSNLDPHEFLGLEELNPGSFVTITLGDAGDGRNLVLLNVTIDR